MIHELWELLRLPRVAWRARLRDFRGPQLEDPGINRVVQAAIDWLLTAQRCSLSQDGGIARHYSLISGWSTSYPETSGYIVPTLLECSERFSEPKARSAAFGVLEWLVSIQLPSGAFQGGRVDSRPVIPVTFNTGQILLGLAAGARHDKRYVGPMVQAASWLRDTQDPDGCWRRFPTPFAEPGEKAYETHVAWGLLEADRMAPNLGFCEAALRNVEWALKAQCDNGWVKDCCLTDPSRPLTHTLGYYLRGLTEAHRYFESSSLLAAAIRTADGLMSAVRPDGALPGRVAADWSAAARWSCLTGVVQIAYCWLYLFKKTRDARYLAAGKAANRFVRRTVEVSSVEPQETRGGVKGSFPIHGDYGSYEYLNWAPKFLIDACLLESSIDQRCASENERPMELNANSP